MNQVKIAKRKIGEGQPAFIVAELSCNHLQKFDLAVETVKAVKESGADAIKIQTYTPDTMTIDCDNDNFQIKHGTLWDGMTLHKLYEEAYTPWDWDAKLQKLAHKLGLIFFSTPFDKSAVDFLEKLNVPAYKLASFEITDVGLIEYMAKKGKPMIMSTGISTMSDIKEAIDACHKVDNYQIIILKCTSAYPSPLEEVNLRTIPNIAETFNVIVGLSDHTKGIAVPIGAVSLGAKVVEKHFILDRKLGGHDAPFSLEPSEFKQMVKEIRDVEKALGKVDYELTPKMKTSRELLSRSLFVTRDIKKGEKFTEKNIRSIRPGYGLHPRFLPELLGKKSPKNLKKGTPITWGLIG